jgi:hypothetical protein
MEIMSRYVDAAVLIDIIVGGISQKRTIEETPGHPSSQYQGTAFTHAGEKHDYATTLNETKAHTMTMLVGNLWEC